jgi:hypothetical protein
MNKPKGTVNLWYLAKPVYGGWVSYTVHLCRALAQAGFAVNLYRLGAATAKVYKPWSGGLQSRLIGMAGISAAAAGAEVNIVTCADKHHTTALAAVLKRGGLLVVHDPTEMRDGLLTVAKQRSVGVVAIRKANVPALHRHGIEAAFVPHPYVTSGDLVGGDEQPRYFQRQNACALSRLDWDKQTHVIAGANAELDGAGQGQFAVDIYGAMNRLYCHHKVFKVDPTWDRHYCGQFPRHWGAAVEIAKGYRYMVDLSKISGDGGGTQYTFLEAWEAGCHLIVARDWLLDHDDTMQDGVNCTAVSGPTELAQQLAEPPSRHVVANGAESLRGHAGGRVVGQLLGFAESVAGKLG